MELYFAERLRKYRRERDLTQEELAQVIGVSYQSVSKWDTAVSQNQGYYTKYPRLQNLCYIYSHG